MSDAAAAAPAQLELRIEHILARARPVTVDDTCCVCLDKLSQDAEQDFVPCDQCHALFHRACIMRDDSRRCPLCRENVVGSITSSRFARKVFKNDPKGTLFARNLASLFKTAMNMYLHGGARVLGCRHILAEMGYGLANTFGLEACHLVTYLQLCAIAMRRGRAGAFEWISVRGLAPELSERSELRDMLDSVCMALKQALDHCAGFRSWLNDVEKRFSALVDTGTGHTIGDTEEARRNRLLRDMEDNFGDWLDEEISDEDA